MSPCQRIFLIGYRGSGKTAVARLVAERLGWSWCDADQVLEERFGTTIRQIFLDEGEPGFRDKESLVLAELAQSERRVIATGGGVILRPQNREQLRAGVTIWLQADAETSWQRMQADQATLQQRPNLAQGGLAEVEAMLRAREPLYRAYADHAVEASRSTPEELAGEIVSWLRASPWGPSLY